MLQQETSKHKSKSVIANPREVTDMNNMIITLIFSLLSDTKERPEGPDGMII